MRNQHLDKAIFPFKHDDVEILATENLYKGFVHVEKLSLKHRLFADQSFSKTIQREIVHRREAAGVLVVDLELRQLLLIQQFRAGALNAKTTPWQLEVIAGLIDDGENAESCIRREALEEANCTIQQTQLIQSFYTSTGASDEVFHLYAATADLSQAGGIHGEISEGEDILVQIFDFEEVDTLFAQGHICNSPLIIALQWLKLQQFQPKF